MEAVVRDVDADIDLETIAAAGHFATVTRMHRTSGPVPRPLPLVRVTCESREQLEHLLANGITIRGKLSAVELPETAAHSSAALGKRPVVNVDAVLRLQPVSNALCVPSTSGSASDVSAAAVVVCRETSDYHAVAASCIGVNDCVLEIGSDLGALCAIAYPLCEGRLVGVDLSETSIARAQQSHPNICFQRLDALQVGSGLALRNLADLARASAAKGVPTEPTAAPKAPAPTASSSQTAPFTRVFIDINGNRLLPAVAGVLQIALEELDAPFICCKSRALHAALTASHSSCTATTMATMAHARQDTSVGDHTRAVRGASTAAHE